MPNYDIPTSLSHTHVLVVDREAGESKLVPRDTYYQARGPVMDRHDLSGIRPAGFVFSYASRTSKN